jgi:hypothetical protein
VDFDDKPTAPLRIAGHRLALSTPTAGLKRSASAASYLLHFLFVVRIPYSQKRDDMNVIPLSPDFKRAVFRAIILRLIIEMNSRMY